MVTSLLTVVNWFSSSSKKKRNLPVTTRSPRRASASYAKDVKYLCDASKPEGPVDHRQPAKTPVNIWYPNITLICLIYGDPFLYNFLTINQFVMIFHKSLMYNSFTLLYAKIY